jgi:hypothetical protein
MFLFRQPRTLVLAAGALCVALELNSVPAFGEEAGGLVTGRVVDRATGLPLESVNVFLVSTTRGTVTNTDGRFVLRDLPSGFFQLMASRVDYESVVLRLEVRSGDTIQQAISLLPRVLKAPEVQIEAESPDAWQKDLEDFKHAFLGADRFGKGCNLLNPEVVEFHHDPKTEALSASSDSVLRVRNVSLGYLLYVTVDRFRWNAGTNAVEYTLYVRFEPLRPATAADSVQWNRNRREAYRGSLRHFLRSLAAARLTTGEFYVMNERGESLGREGEKVAIHLPGGTCQLVTEGILRVDYAGESQAHRNYIRLAQGLVHVAANGTLQEHQDFVIDPISWWAQHRIGRMLPLDYVP